MEKKTVEEVRKHLGRLIPPASSEPVLLTRYDMPVAVIIPLSWLGLSDTELLARMRSMP